MAKTLPKKDVVIMGLGWTGSILAQELTQAGLSVVAIERGPWRDTATDFNIGYMPDELRYAVRRDLFLQPKTEAMTMRNSAAETALPKISGEFRRTAAAKILRTAAPTIALRKLPAAIKSVSAMATHFIAGHPRSAAV